MFKLINENKIICNIKSMVVNNKGKDLRVWPIIATILALNVFSGFGNYITDIRPMISQNQSCKIKNPFLPHNRIKYPYTRNKE